MSASLFRLMDREKYLLASMVYFHLPPEIARRDFEAAPLPLSEQIDLIPWCECGSANAKGPDGTDLNAMRRTHAELRHVYDTHPELHDLRLTGYVNDNAGAYSTTGTKGGSSFVAMSFRDDEGNGLVVYSGCETHRLRPMAVDYAGCFLAMLGKVTHQHRLALRFYDHAMADVTGERGIIGHSKGGNLATYVFISRLDQPTQAYCINAQPYCWWAMNARQQAALKSERYEFIAHAGDVVHHAGYVSYVSRVVQMNS